MARNNRYLSSKEVPDRSKITLDTIRGQSTNAQLSRGGYIGGGVVGGGWWWWWW